MNEDYVLRQEYNEFGRRLDAENERQNRRIELLEETVKRINDLTIQMGKMAANMENMLEVLKKQGSQIEALEKEPAETSKQIKQAIITAVVGTVVGAVVTAIIMIL